MIMHYIKYFIYRNIRCVPSFGNFDIGRTNAPVAEVNGYSCRPVVSLQGSLKSER